MLKKFLCFTIIFCVLFTAVFSAHAAEDAVSFSARINAGGNSAVIEVIGNTSIKNDRVSVRINYPNGHICYINQITSSSDGSFAASCDILNPYNGMYEITVGTRSGVYTDTLCVDIFKDIEISEPSYSIRGEDGDVYDAFDYSDATVSADIVNNGGETQSANMYNYAYNTDNGTANEISKTTVTVPSGSQSKISDRLSQATFGSKDTLRTLFWDNRLFPLTEPTERGTSAESFFPDVSPLYRCFARGVLNPDAGTIQIKLKINRPIEYFGSDYDYIFEMYPAKTFSTNIKTMFGLIITPATERTVYVPFRTGNGNYWLMVDWNDFVYTPGEEFTLAVTWKAGGEIALYIDGRKLPARYGSECTSVNGFNPELIPYDMTFFNGGVFDISSVKISSDSLGDRELSENAHGKFERDENTVMIADNNLKNTQYYTSQFLSETGFTSCVPAWKEDSQCFSLNEKQRYPVCTVNHGESECEYNISVQIEDSNGNTVDSVSADITVPSDGKYRIYNVNLPVMPGAGLYTLHTTITGGGKTEEYDSRISVLPADNKSIPDGKLADSYGNVVALEDSAGYISKLNARYTRDFNAFSWQLIEPNEGEFYWDKTDSYIQRCKQAGIECIGLLNKVPGWAAKEPDYDKHNPRITSYPPRDINEWYNYVYQTVARYKDDVHYWEIMNEVNYHPPYSVGGTSCSPEQYREMLFAAYRAAKAADPGCYVLVAGFAAPFGELDKQMPYDYTEPEYCQGYYDIYNIHGYNGTQIWEDILQNLHKNRPDTPVWMTEYYPLAYTDADDMAFFNIQTYAAFIGAGCEKFINMGAHGSETYASYAERSPTKCYQATGTLQSIIRKCNEYISKIDIKNGENLPLREVFRRTDGKYVYVIGSNTLTSAVLTARGRVTDAADMYGTKIRPSLSNGVYNIPVNNKVVYVIADGDVEFTLVSDEYANLIVNGEFENTIGNTVTDWSFSASDGSVELVCPGNENHVIRMIADKNDSRFIMQNKTITSDLKCRMSASVKNVSSVKASVYLGYNNRDLYFEGKTSVTERVFEILPNSSEKIECVLDIPKTEKMPHAIIVGIKSGSGVVYVDDVKLEIISE